MARTVQEVATSARGTLNDIGKARSKDPEVIGFVVDALNMMRNARPDLFIGRLATPFGTLALSSVLPIDEQFFRPIVDYVIARCESKNDEEINNGRVQLMATLATGFLK